jgi:hypothetical protein
MCLAAAAAAGCANTVPAKSATPPLPGKDACVFTVNLTDWVVLDDSTLIVYGPVHKEPYLVKLFAPVTGLQFRQSLGFESTAHNGQLCSGDYVLARGDIPQRMPIAALRAISPEQAKQLRAAAK